MTRKRNLMNSWIAAEKKAEANMTNKILLVDDEKDIVDLVEEVLQREGFQSIQKAFTGKEAVNLCRQFQPDVVVLDITLALLGVPLWWGGGYSVVSSARRSSNIFSIHSCMISFCSGK